MIKKMKERVGLIMFFLFVISTAVFLTIWNVPLYQLTLSYYDIPEKVGMSQARILENYFLLLKYLHVPWINKLSLPDFPMSDSGIFHFYEVKRLFLLNLAIFFGSGIYSIFFWKRQKSAGTCWRFHSFFKRALWIPLGILFVLMISFDEIFILFHEVVFRNEYWIFNPSTDPIILVLPQEFFLFCFLSTFIWIEFFIWLAKEKTKI